tara:strand:- start:205 stop:612 length:408 start_codon:yes stop_codon:yes gene_type:complete
MSNPQQTKQHCFYTLQNDELSRLAEKVVANLSTVNFDRIACIDLLPLALTSMVSISLKKPFVIIRKETKGYGTNNAIEGYFEDNDRLALLTFDFDQETKHIVSMLEHKHFKITTAIIFQKSTFPSDLSFNCNYID